jgi:hypothetical protein
MVRRICLVPASANLTFQNLCVNLRSALINVKKIFITNNVISIHNRAGGTHDTE